MSYTQQLALLVDGYQHLNDRYLWHKVFISFCLKEEAEGAEALSLSTDGAYWPSQRYDEEPNISFIET